MCECVLGEIRRVDGSCGGDKLKLFPDHAGASEAVHGP
jgi:hypothetical protein